VFRELAAASHPGWHVASEERSIEMAETFVVKAIYKTGRVGWLTPACANGLRSISIRSTAAVFATKEQAQLAIDKMPGLFWTIGVAFSIEDDDS